MPTCRYYGRRIRARGNGGMRYFFATRAAVLAPLPAAARLERWLGLAPAPAPHHRSTPPPLPAKTPPCWPRSADVCAEAQVGVLGAPARRGAEPPRRVRSFSAEAIAQRLAQADERLGLGAEIPRRLDHLLEFGLVRGGVVGGGAVPGEQ